MSRMTEIFPSMLEGSTQDEISYIESYVFAGKSTADWITEAENTLGVISEDPIYHGEPKNNSIMSMARTSIIIAREAYKLL